MRWIPIRRTLNVLLASAGWVATADGAAADSLRFDADFVAGGNGTLAELTLDQPVSTTTDYLISLSGTNAALADKGFQVSAGQRTARFKLKTTATAVEQFVDVSILSEDRAKTIAASRLKVIPARLTELRLSRSSVVGGTSNGVVSVEVVLDGLAPATGLTVALGSSCLACDPEREANLLRAPTSVQIPAGAPKTKFELHPAAVVRAREVTLLASLAGVTKTANLIDDTLRPQSISVSPSSIAGTQEATLTLTLNAPAYDGYAIQLTCSQPLNVTGARCQLPTDSSRLRLAAAPVGQQTWSYQVHSQQLTSPTQITIAAQGFLGAPIAGLAQTTLIVAP